MLAWKLFDFPLRLLVRVFEIYSFKMLYNCVPCVMYSNVATKACLELLLVRNTYFTFKICSCRLKREAHEKGYARISWTYWFSKLLYHQVALVYVLTRLVTNVSQVSLHLLRTVSTFYAVLFYL